MASISRLRAITFAILSAAVCLAVPRMFGQQDTKQQGAAADQQANPSVSEKEARKKRFEEARKRLEDSQSAQEPATAPGRLGAFAGSTLLISPARVTMLVGDTQPFCAFDIDGKTLTKTAEWTLSDTKSGSLVSRNPPVVSSISPGVFSIQATMEGRSVEAQIIVLPGNALPMGAQRWTAGEIPGYKTQQVTPAIPSANGPDLYSREVNASGETIIRAFTSEGVQLWMRKMNGSVGSMVVH